MWVWWYTQKSYTSRRPFLSILSRKERTKKGGGETVDKWKLYSSASIMKGYVYVYPQWKFAFSMRLLTVQRKAGELVLQNMQIYRKNAEVWLVMVNYEIVIIDREGSSLRALAPEAEGSGCCSRATSSGDVCWRGAGHAFQQHPPTDEAVSVSLAKHLLSIIDPE